LVGKNAGEDLQTIPHPPGISNIRMVLASQATQQKYAIELSTADGGYRICENLSNSTQNPLRIHEVDGILLGFDGLPSILV
jgi:hypothetical protein